MTAFPTSPELVALIKRFVDLVLQDEESEAFAIFRDLAHEDPVLTSASISAIGARLIEGGEPEPEAHRIMTELREATGLTIGRGAN